jgi:ubiquinone/menaquinone biosynthesis C-methylase UbiE
MDLQQLAAQLRKPEGDKGLQVALMMNKGNKLLNQWVIEAMQLKKSESVLEIGMGNGFFVKDILGVDNSITYSGLDYSSLMTEQAITLNREFVNTNRAVFVTGDSASLPFPDNSFSDIMAVNTIYFWENEEKELSEMKRVLIPGGKIVMGMRSKKAMEHMPFTEFGFRKFDTVEIIRLLESNNFKILDIAEKKEPAYEFNGVAIQMENIIVSCTK